LLQNGEKDAALEHLKLVGKFWRNTVELCRWRKEIEDGRILMNSRGPEEHATPPNPLCLPRRLVAP